MLILNVRTAKNLVNIVICANSIINTHFCFDQNKDPIENRDEYCNAFLISVHVNTYNFLDPIYRSYDIVLCLTYLETLLTYIRMSNLYLYLSIYILQNTKFL